MKATSVFSLFILFYFLGHRVANAQEVVPLENFIGFVKRHHPFVKQAQLRLDASEAKLLKERGAFDPTFLYEQGAKSFNGLTYYEKEQTQVSIPTLFGLSLNARMQQAQGNYLDPENQITGDQLYSLGASLDLARGLLSNPRQTALKQAKLFTKQAQEENALEINKILEAALHAYFDWYKAYRNYEIFDRFVVNAAFRFEGVKKRNETGDLAVIDTTEARISYNQRLLDKENAFLELRKKALEASNFLWIENQPIELTEKAEPQLDKANFEKLFKSESFILENHPKIRVLAYKQNQLILEKRLQKNNLLPEVNLNYQWLSSTNPISQINFALDPENKTTGLKIKVPLLLRKERANLKLASLKLSDIEWEQSQAKVALENKIQALFIQKERLKKQELLAKAMAEDYQLLYEGEKRKFEAGESSLFLVNARESQLIQAILKSISLEVEQRKTEITYYYSVTFPE
ncbi:TolC family protein [Flavobacteriaceae bacterium]|nr:TolC family protein [Flavobacteriaceae bacterium]